MVSRTVNFTLQCITVDLFHSTLPSLLNICFTLDSTPFFWFYTKFLESNGSTARSSRIVGYETTSFFNYFSFLPLFYRRLYHAFALQIRFRYYFYCTRWIMNWTAVSSTIYLLSYFFLANNITITVMAIVTALFWDNPVEFGSNIGLLVLFPSGMMFSAAVLPTVHLYSYSSCAKSIVRTNFLRRIAAKLKSNHCCCSTILLFQWKMFWNRVDILNYQKNTVSAVVSLIMIEVIRT